MLTFPNLNTGAAVQYPFNNTEAFGNDVLLFLGGDEQRYRTTPAPLRTWIVRLDLLDEAEMQRVEALFQATSGSNDTFSFTDPTSGTVYPSCYFTSDSLTETFEGNLHGKTSLVFRENRVRLT